MMCGGTSEIKEADETIQNFCDEIRGEFESKTQKCDEFTAKQYKNQLVAGMNYFVKVKVADGKFVHLRIYRPLPDENNESKLQLASYQENKTSEEEIKYF